MVTHRTEDIWKRWLLERRFGGDEYLMDSAFREFLIPCRDRVLKHASIKEGDVLLDVGCGDGLIAFGALDRYDSIEVIFSDISQPLLDHAYELAREMGVADRCRFLNAPAEELRGLPGGSVDVVTTRSVLIYVADKEAALNEFYRVLRPDGRISLYEPINRFGFPSPDHVIRGYDLAPIAPIAQKIKAHFRAIQPPDDPMLNFDERDLLRFAEEAGFREIHFEYDATVQPLPPHREWDRFLDTAGNPRIPTIREALEQALTPAEQKTFTEHLRPLVESGQGTSRFAQVYFWAVK